ncbi:MAG: DUF2236 domain-containing protein, partial [Armatimonadetes bacterium]|nr:DUF2236 domain-containing protein [Anaerolineae bacterium]
MRRDAITDEIAQLDPIADHLRIVYLVGTREFPFTTQRSLEMALFRTFASERIAALLDRTGQFAHAGQKRYDDTMLIIAEIAEFGYDSERGAAAIRIMNRMHRRYAIANEDFLYVLSTFAIEPIKWNHALGWRLSTAGERLANFTFWQEVGRRMGIHDIPATLEDLWRFQMDYETRYFKFSAASQRVGQAGLAIFTQWFPALMRPLVRTVVYGLLDDMLLTAFGFPHPPQWWRKLLYRAMRLRAWAVGLVHPSGKPYSVTALRSR